MLRQSVIEKLKEVGFNRWVKGSMDRLYINAKELGLVCEYYKTGNIAYAEFQGEKISNSQAGRFMLTKTYIDVNTGDVVSDYKVLKEAAAEMLAQAEA